MTKIKFGTSGWRGLIARDFTFDNVRVATQGIADYLTQPENAKSKLIIMGYDTRFLGREFSLAAAEVLASNQFIPLLCNRDTPTPVIAHTIRSRKAAGGVNMTASHNPAEYQGLKFSTGNGAPAPPEVTKQIETNIARRQTENWTFKSAVIGTYECSSISARFEKRNSRLRWNSCLAPGVVIWISCWKIPA
jgi:phosphomannomutase